MSCPFCSRIRAGAFEDHNSAAVAFPDGYPLSTGHMLVVPLKHEPDMYQLSASEQAGVWELVRGVRERMAQELKPDGFNIETNVGAAASWPRC
jgi:diadenosine tetraphosphate (Ap4A) HIT family hydrolase